MVLAAIACVAVAAPLALAASGYRVIVAPKESTTKFPGVDWECTYTAATVNPRAPEQVSCNRISTYRGLHVFVNGDIVSVARATGTDKLGLPTRWVTLYSTERKP